MRAFCLGLTFLAFAAPAFAQDDDEAAACMTPVPITQALVEEAGRYEFSGYAGAGAVPTLLVGWVSPSGVMQDDAETGSIVFVRNADASWRAFSPHSGEGVVGVYAAPSGAMIVITQWQTEGPGQSWTLLRSPDGLQTGACTEVRFPGTLNQPAWNNDTLSLHDLDVDARGRGEIIGLERNEEHGERWYLYRTRDHGQTWSTSRRLAAERDARAGIYQPVLDEEHSPASPELVAELTRYAAGR